MPPLWKKNSAFHHNICFEKKPEMQGESIITSFYLELKIQIERFRGLLRFNVHGGHFSVRAMQYILDIAINTKIPEDVVHELPFKCFRT